MKNELVRRVELKTYLREAGNALARAMGCCKDPKMEAKLHAVTHEVSRFHSQVEKEVEQTLNS